MGMPTPACKKNPHPPPVLKVEVRLEAIGAAEPLATAPRFAEGSDRAYPLGAKAPERPGYRYEGYR